MQHLDPGGSQRRLCRRDGVVEPARALGAAGDQQGGRVRSQAEPAPRLLAQGGPVQRGDHPPDRQADVTGSGQRCVREADRDGPGQPRPQLVRDAGHGVALVHHERQASPARGQVGRHGDVAAVADHHVGAHPVDHVEGGAHRPEQPGRHLDQVRRGAARERHRRDQLQRVAGFGDHPLLQPLRGAQRGHLDAGIDPGQGVGGGEQRRGVTRRPAPGKQNTHGAIVPGGPGRPRR